MPLPIRLSILLKIAGLVLTGGLLAGCMDDYADTAAPANKHLQPLSATTYQQLQEKGMQAGDPILVRIYKDESKLEVWKRKADDGRYAFFKSYVICRWSGQLGPKAKEGDRQAPEGFYAITPGQMNPKSNYYLSFNIGYPNSYDRALGRTGTNLMVHGACSSAGCYSMTDENIAEIYSLAREAFNGGQRSFQVQAFPFRMTAENMARFRSNPNISFWKNLKEGSDHFEVTRQEPKISVCGKRYVFDATAPDGTPLLPGAPCPAIEVPPEIGSAVAMKAKADEMKVAQLAAEGFAEAPLEVRQPLPGKSPVPVLLAPGENRERSRPVPRTGPVQMASTAAPAGPDAGPATRPATGVQVAALDSSTGPSVFGRLFGSTATENAEAQAYASPDQEPLYKRVLNLSWLKGSSKEPVPATVPTAATPAPASLETTDQKATAGPAAIKAVPVPPRPAALAAAPAPPASAGAPAKAVAMPVVTPARSGAAAPVETARAAPIATPSARPVTPDIIPDTRPAEISAPLPPPAAAVAAQEPTPAAVPAPSPSRITGAFSYFN